MHLKIAFIVLSCFFCLNIKAQTKEEVQQVLEGVESIDQLPELKSKNLKMFIREGIIFLSDSVRVPEITHAKEGMIIHYQYGSSSQQYAMKVLAVRDEPRFRLRHFPLNGEIFSENQIDSIVSIVKQRYSQGESFDDLATELGLHKKEATDTGWFPRGLVLKELEEAGQQLAKGEIVTKHFSQWRNSWQNVILKTHNNKVERAVIGIEIRYSGN